MVSLLAGHELYESQILGKGRCGIIKETPTFCEELVFHWKMWECLGRSQDRSCIRINSHKRLYHRFSIIKQDGRFRSSLPLGHEKVFLSLAI